jgi:hypothetical protein
MKCNEVSMGKFDERFNNEERKEKNVDHEAWASNGDSLHKQSRMTYKSAAIDEKILGVRKET